MSQSYFAPSAVQPWNGARGSGGIPIPGDFQNRTGRALGNPTEGGRWPSFQQRVGLETSRGLFAPELFCTSAAVRVE